MTTGWTAPGSTESSDAPATDAAENLLDGGDPAQGGTVDHHPAHGSPAAGHPSLEGPRRELVQDVPLFPLRPLSLGEIFGAAMRIYRLRARTVLVLSAIVYGVAFVLMTFTTGAGMIPFFGEMQAIMEDPTATSSTTSFSASNVLLTVGTSMITAVITMVASSLVTVALTAVAIGEATGQPVTSARMWARTRRLALPAVCVSILVGLLSLVAMAVPTVLGALPLLLLQKASVLTIVPVIVGLAIGLLASLWVWVRTLLAIPALVVEDTGIIGSIRLAFRRTSGRKLWRVTGVGLLIYVAFFLATQVVAGVFGTVAFIVYLGLLLATSGSAIVAGMILLTIISMLGSYVSYVLMAPFLSAGIAAVYADNRMRHEAWDIELTRRAREGWAAGGTR